MEYFLLAILWIAWYALHSAMISLRFTVFLRQRLGPRYRYYRLFFNMTAAFTIVFPLWYGAHVKKHLLWQVSGFPALLRWVLLAVALVLSLAGAMKYDLRQLLGIRQILSGQSAKGLTASGELDTSGVLAVIRHPWYLAALILVWTWHSEIYASSLMVQVILSTYLVIGTLLEERKLVVEYGDAYREYQKRVSMLLPVRWFVAKWRKVNI